MDIADLPSSLAVVCPLDRSGSDTCVARCSVFALSRHPVWALPGGFSSLSSVALLFQNRGMLLAGWVHYLAFDLFVGSWEVRDSRAAEIRHYLIVPCLLLTFLFGPAGWVLYLLIRSVANRIGVIENAEEAALSASHNDIRDNMIRDRSNDCQLSARVPEPPVDDLCDWGPGRTRRWDIRT